MPQRAFQYAKENIGFHSKLWLWSAKSHEYCGFEGNTPNHCLEIANIFVADSDTAKRGLLAHLTLVSGAAAAEPSRAR